MGTKTSKIKDYFLKSDDFEWKEIAAHGAVLGMILFITTTVALATSFTLQEIEPFVSYLPGVLVFYLVFGILLTAFHSRPRHRKKRAGWVLAGISGIMVFFLLMWFIVFAVVRTVPYLIRATVVINLLVIAVVWVIEYLCMANASKEMNANTKSMGRSLIEMLDEYPKGEDAFIEAIAKYCGKNHIELEVITAEKPAVVKMDGVYHKVSVTSWYSYTGPVYGLKFEEMDIPLHYGNSENIQEKM